MRKKRFRGISKDDDTPLNQAVSKRDRDILTMVDDAIRHEQAILAYQKVVMAQNPQKIGFYEGLMRVPDETGRIIPAREFMPIVETTELGREIDVRALSLGLAALHEHRDLRLAVNMSARSIGYSRWMDVLESWLDRDETLGERLIMEITESSAILQPEVTVDFMQRASRLGICFAMDDFGAGNTALRYFKDFFFDIVKIDGQFCNGLAHSPENEAIVKAMVSIARHFDMLIVAEGVERRDDAQRLCELGVDCLQGFLFEPPTLRPNWMYGERRNGRVSANVA